MLSSGSLAIACARVTMCSATKHGDFLGFSLFSTTLTEADWLTHGLLLLACYGGRCRLRGATASHCSERVNFVQNKWDSCHCKGQLISKCLFGVFNFFQKRNENKSTWGIIVVKLNSFFRFLEKFTAWQFAIKYYTPLIPSEISRENARAWVLMDFK